MCKLSRKSGLKRIDPCMKTFISELNFILKKGEQICACCCGHEKYPMTIVLKRGEYAIELFSGKLVNRKKRYYKRDKQGYYYIPECVSEQQSEGNKK